MPEEFPALAALTQSVLGAPDEAPRATPRVDRLSRLVAEETALRDQLTRTPDEQAAELASPEPRVAPHGFGEHLRVGGRAGVGGMQSGYHAFTALMHEALQSPEEKIAVSLQNMRYRDEEVALQMANVRPFAEFMEEPTAMGFVNRVGLAMGQVGPSLGVSVAGALAAAALGGGAAIGGAALAVGSAGNTAARHILSKLFSKAVTKQALSKAEQEALDLSYGVLRANMARAAKVGAVGGLATVEFPLAAGQAGAELYDPENLGTGGDPEMQDVLKAFGAGAASASLAVAGETLLLRSLLRMARASPSADPSDVRALQGAVDGIEKPVTILRGAAKGTALSGVTEGLTETGQEAIQLGFREHTDPGFLDREDTDAASRLLEAGFTGLVGSAPFGGLGGTGSALMSRARRMAKGDVRSDRPGRQPGGPDGGPTVEPASEIIAQMKATTAPGVDKHGTYVSPRSARHFTASLPEGDERNRLVGSMNAIREAFEDGENAIAAVRVPGVDGEMAVAAVRDPVSGEIGFAFSQGVEQWKAANRDNYVEGNKTGPELMLTQLREATRLGPEAGTAALAEFLGYASPMTGRETDVVNVKDRDGNIVHQEAAASEDLIERTEELAKRFKGFEVETEPADDALRSRGRRADSEAAARGETPGFQLRAAVDGAAEPFVEDVADQADQPRAMERMYSRLREAGHDPSKADFEMRQRDAPAPEPEPEGSESVESAPEDVPDWDDAMIREAEGRYGDPGQEPPPAPTEAEEDVIRQMKVDNAGNGIRSVVRLLQESVNVDPETRQASIAQAVDDTLGPLLRRVATPPEARTARRRDINRLQHNIIPRTKDLATLAERRAELREHLAAEAFDNALDRNGAEGVMADRDALRIGIRRLLASGEYGNIANNEALAEAEGTIIDILTGQDLEAGAAELRAEDIDEPAMDEGSRSDLDDDEADFDQHADIYSSGISEQTFGEEEFDILLPTQRRGDAPDKLGWLVPRERAHRGIPDELREKWDAMLEMLPEADRATFEANRDNISGSLARALLADDSPVAPAQGLGFRLMVEDDPDTGRTRVRVMARDEVGERGVDFLVERRVQGAIKALTRHEPNQYNNIEPSGLELKGPDGMRKSLTAVSMRYLAARGASVNVLTEEALRGSGLTPEQKYKAGLLRMLKEMTIRGYDISTPGGRRLDPLELRAPGTLLDPDHKLPEEVYNLVVAAERNARWGNRGPRSFVAPDEDKPHGVYTVRDLLLKTVDPYPDPDSPDAADLQQRSGLRTGDYLGLLGEQGPGDRGGRARRETLKDLRDAQRALWTALHKIIDDRYSLNPARASQLKRVASSIQIYNREGPLTMAQGRLLAELESDPDWEFRPSTRLRSMYKEHSQRALDFARTFMERAQRFDRDLDHLLAQDSGVRLEDTGGPELAPYGSEQYYRVASERLKQANKAVESLKSQENPDPETMTIWVREQLAAKKVAEAAAAAMLLPPDVRRKAMARARAPFEQRPEDVHARDKSNAVGVESADANDDAFFMSRYLRTNPAASAAVREYHRAERALENVPPEPTVQYRVLERAHREMKKKRFADVMSDDVVAAMDKAIPGMADAREDIRAKDFYGAYHATRRVEAARRSRLQNARRAVDVALDRLPPLTRADIEGYDLPWSSPAPELFSPVSDASVRGRSRIEMALARLEEARRDKARIETKRSKPHRSETTERLTAARSQLEDPNGYENAVAVSRSLNEAAGVSNPQFVDEETWRGDRRREITVLERELEAEMENELTFDRRAWQRANEREQEIGRELNRIREEWSQTDVDITDRQRRERRAMAGRRHRQIRVLGKLPKASQAIVRRFQEMYGSSMNMGVTVYTASEFRNPDSEGLTPEQRLGLDKETARKLAMVGDPNAEESVPGTVLFRRDGDAVIVVADANQIRNAPWMGQYGRQQPSRDLAQALTIGHELGHIMYRAEYNRLHDGDGLTDTGQKLWAEYLREREAVQQDPEAFGLPDFEEWWSDKVAAHLVAGPETMAQDAQRTDPGLAQYFRRVADALKQWLAVLNEHVFGNRFNVNTLASRYINAFADQRRFGAGVVNEGVPPTADLEMRQMIVDVKRAVRATRPSNLLRKGRDLWRKDIFSGLHGLVEHANSELRSMSPGLGRFFAARAGTADPSGFHDDYVTKTNADMNRLGDALGVRKRTDWESFDVKEALALAEDETWSADSDPTRPVSDAALAKARAVRKILREYYVKNFTGPDALVKVAFRANYYPREIDVAYLEGSSVARQQLADLLKKYSGAKGGRKLDNAEAKAAVERIVAGGQGLDALGNDEGETGLTPGMGAAERRVLADVPTPELRELELVTDARRALNQYFYRANRKLEYERRGGSKKILELLAALPKEKRARAEYLVRSQLGLVGHRNISKGWRTFVSYANVITAWTTLAFSAYSSLPEAMAPLVRSNRVVNVLDAVRQISGQGRDENRELARAIGIVGPEALDAMFMSVGAADFVTPSARRSLTWFFDATGVNAITNFTRAFAVGIGREFLLSAAKNPNTELNSRYLDNLGVTAEQVQRWDRAGRPTDGSHAEVEAAIRKYALESVVLPTPATRPAVGNDPRFAFMYHLKTFFWDFGYRFIAGFGRETWTLATSGRKMLAAWSMAVLGATMLPMAALGLELREISKWLIRAGTSGAGFDAPDPDRAFRSDEMGTMEYLYELTDRAGLFGPFTLATSSVAALNRNQNPLIAQVPIADFVEQTFIRGRGERALPVINNAF